MEQFSVTNQNGKTTVFIVLNEPYYCFIYCIFYNVLKTNLLYSFFFPETDCDILPRFENAVLIENEKQSYRSGERVIFKCAPSYQMYGSNIVTCVNRMWIGELVCKGSLKHFQHVFIIALED